MFQASTTSQQMNYNNKAWLTFGILIASSLLIRFFSFFHWIIDHDESTYLVIANELNHGAVYLKDVIDTKPIGIFWLYGLMLKIAGPSFFMLRLLTSIFIAFTSFLIYSLQWKWTGNQAASWISAITYILMISTFTRWGLGPNTEIFFVAFIAMALYLLISFNTAWMNFAVGICFGVAFHIKYVVAADVFAFITYFAIQAFRSQQGYAFLINRIFWIAIGFLLVTGFVLLYYFHHNCLDLFLSINSKVGSQYASSTTLFDRLKFLADFFFRFSPVTGLVFWGLIRGVFKFHPYKCLLLFWIVMDLMIVLYPGKYFEHYFIQIMPVVSLMFGFWFTNGRGLQFIHWTKKRLWLMTCCLSLLTSGLMVAHYKAFILKPEPIKQVYEYLIQQLKPGETFYTGNSHHLLYFLFNQKSLCPYVHSSLIWNKEHRRALDIDVSHEINRIRSHEPEYILWDERSDESKLKNQLLAGYLYRHPIGEHLFVYRKQP